MMDNHTECLLPAHVAYNMLITIYSAAFVGGSAGIVTMTFVLCRANTRSVTTTAVINLLVVHSVFLLTVPFRIAYYIQKKWIFGFYFCKVVSAMIHIHMYLCCVFYVTILGIRCISFFKHKDKIEFYRTLHSVVASSAVWIVVLVVILPLFFWRYGVNGSYNTEECFRFEMEFANHYVVIMNYIATAVIITLGLSLLTVQIVIIVKVVRKLHGSVFSHQEFWAQLKSLVFISVMIICFFPYHLFRIYYIHHAQHFFMCNEIFLSITALCCLDLISFSLKTYFQKVRQSMAWVCVNVNKRT
ncbi:probable G-protein coupled receptor 141 [Spea bombifrons]|uniref:probable G-protein coupled receptor 141 n=1 Tax=Spea bombifrons TaxID=233779 RepID=UPI00234A57A0|nr:probable G-protein coupled receptor 141 [Spea bombifrons]